MKVTDIKQQAKDQSRYSIFVDNKYSFSLSELGLINSGLRVGQDLTRQQLGKLKNDSQIDKGYNQALNLIVRRPRSEWELQDYLRRKGYQPPEAQAILNKLSERGFVNDEKFAKAWVDNRRLLKSTSKRRLTQELRQKRISDNIIKQVLEDDETNEREVLRELITRKQKQTRYQDKTKLMQYLSRQGFRYDDIKSVIEGEDLPGEAGAVWTVEVGFRIS